MSLRSSSDSLWTSMLLSISRTASPPMPAVKLVLAVLLEEPVELLLGEQLALAPAASPWGR